MTLPTNVALMAALGYARRGIPVFPLAPGTKIPHAGTNGSRDATTDENSIVAWWAGWPGSNVSVATGRKSNLFVLDVDVQHGGHTTLASLESTYGKIPRTPTVRTPSGGQHCWFAWPDTTADIRNSTGRVGQGLDVKANRGAIVAPPSMLADKRGYRWLTPKGTPLSKPPGWLVRLAIRPPLPDVPAGPIANVSAYVRKAVDEEVAIMRNAVDGTRNDTLNRCAWNLGRLVRDGRLAEATASTELLAAAIEAGMLRQEAEYTIRRTIYRVRN